MYECVVYLCVYGNLIFLCQFRRNHVIFRSEVVEYLLFMQFDQMMRTVFMYVIFYSFSLAQLNDCFRLNKKGFCL